MSTVWRGSEVLWREPWWAVITRVLRRGAIAALALLLSGLPGTSWTGLLSGLWVRVPVAMLGILGLSLFVLGLANLARSKRVVLTIMGTGSVERPRSIQEVWLRRPQEHVVGARIAVTSEGPAFGPSGAEPYVTLEAEGAIKRVPLFRTKPEVFVARVNAVAKSRGVTFVLADVPADA
jgi:hypothetical protein